MEERSRADGSGEQVHELATVILRPSEPDDGDRNETLEQALIRVGNVSEATVWDSLKASATRWLRSFEIVAILMHYQDYNIPLSTTTPSRPPTGSVFLFDKRLVPFFRKDGHEWRQKRGRKSVREDHEKLRIGGHEAINCYYAHHAENGLFTRRIYWLLTMPNIAFVHYLDNRVLDLANSVNEPLPVRSLPAVIPRGFKLPSAGDDENSKRYQAGMAAREAFRVAFPTATGSSSGTPTLFTPSPTPSELHDRRPPRESSHNMGIELSNNAPRRRSRSRSPDTTGTRSRYRSRSRSRSPQRLTATDARGPLASDMDLQPRSMSSTFRPPFAATSSQRSYEARSSLGRVPPNQFSYSRPGASNVMPFPNYEPLDRARAQSAEDSIAALQRLVSAPYTAVPSTGMPLGAPGDPTSASPVSMMSSLQSPVGGGPSVGRMPMTIPPSQVNSNDPAAVATFWRTHQMWLMAQMQQLQMTSMAAYIQAGMPPLLPGMMSSPMPGLMGASGMGGPGFGVPGLLTGAGLGSPGLSGGGLGSSGAGAGMGPYMGGSGFAGSASGLVGSGPRGPWTPLSPNPLTSRSVTPSSQLDMTPMIPPGSDRMDARR